MDLPPGDYQPGLGRRVFVADEDGKPTVGKVHCYVGENMIVMLPDGRLIGRRSSEVSPTSRPFEPISHETLARELISKEFSNFKTHTTPHYVFIYNTSETYALAASRILESMFRGVKAHAKSMQIEPHEPEVPLPVIMFRTEAEFQRYRRMPAGVIAYYHLLDNRVAMYEESSLSQVKRELAIQQAFSTIAHEGAHQILHNIGVQQRLSVWPQWLGEGLAEFFAPTSVGKRFRWKGAGQVNDLRMFELEQYVKSRAADDYDGRLIEQTVGAARLTSTGYAAAWALTHYLFHRNRQEFRDLVYHMSELQPLHGENQPGEAQSSRPVIPNHITYFKKHFGNDFIDMEKGLVSHLRGLDYEDPFADRPHYVALISLPQGRRATRTPTKQAVTFHSPALAEKWRRDILAKLTNEQRSAAQSAIRRFANRAAAEQFAHAWLRGR